MNYYINLPLYSDIKDIKIQYLTLLKSFKDDDNKIKELNKIYAFLKDPLNKFNYDNQLKEELKNNKDEKTILDNLYDDVDKNKITDEDLQKILNDRNKLNSFFDCFYDKKQNKKDLNNDDNKYDNDDEDNNDKNDDENDDEDIDDVLNDETPIGVVWQKL